MALRWRRISSLLGEPAIRPAVVAQAVSVTGSQVTALALPTIAVLALGVTPLAASLLFALEYGVQALAAPLLGVLVDSVRSRSRLMAAADGVHALVVFVVTIAYWTGQLSFGLLVVVAATSGALAGLTSIGLPAVVAQLVAADRLVPANSVLAGARSTGQIVGPAVGGWLVQALGAALSVVVDSLSYGLSALALWRLRAPARVAAPGPRATLRRSLRDGVRVLLNNSVLVRIAIAGAALNIGGAALGGLYVLYAYRRLGLAPATLGLTFAAFSAAAVTGVATAPRLIRRIGLARVVPTFAPIAAAALLLIPAAALTSPVPVLVGYEVVFGYCTTVWTIGSISWQQTLVPVEEIGRVMALTRSIAMLVVPAGALAGGVSAQVFGLLPTMTAFALIALLGTVVVARPAAWGPLCHWGTSAHPSR
jgi:hypothetical protein